MSELSRNHEQNEPTQDEIARLGHLAAHNTQQVAPTEWVQKPGTEIIEPFKGAYLGKLTGVDRFNAGHVDKSTVPVAGTGISFRVYQASHGPTGIEAMAMDGFTVQAAEHDADGNLVWKDKEDWRDGVLVAQDAGVGLQNVPTELWADANFGHQGVQSGIVRVTAPEGDVRHFKLAADFMGEPDGWLVSGTVTEVEPQPSLPTVE